MIGGDGINDESNKTAPAPVRILAHFRIFGLDGKEHGQRVVYTPLSRHVPAR